jgi:hypothetical protein
LLQVGQAGRRRENELSALQIVEVLLAAGYRPTVWRNMAPPNFRSRLLLSGSPRLELFDPINYHGP